MKKKVHYCLVFLLFIVSFSACNPNRFAIDPDSPGAPKEGIATALGQPTGSAVTKVIGPDGGSLVTNDGLVQLAIPAGALTEATTVSLQPITNETPNGMGLAYRLLPADLKLAKAATLVTQFTDADLAGNTPGSIGMAYQHPDKVWYSAVGQTVDAAKRQISAPITRFGDWSTYRQFVLRLKDRSDVNVIYYGETLALEINEILPVSTQNEAPIQSRIAQSIDPNRYAWNLDGHGKLKEVKREGLFTAPTYHPDQNPVTITATVIPANSTQKITLKQDVFVGAGYIRYTFNGQSAYTTSVSLQDQSTGYATILGASNTMPINISFRSNSYGVWPFGDYITNDGTSGLALTLFNDDQQERFDTGHSLCNGQNWFAKGQLALMAYAKGKVARGTFAGNLINRNSTCTSAGPAISGEFLVKMPTTN